MKSTKTELAISEILPLVQGKRMTVKKLETILQGKITVSTFLKYVPHTKERQTVMKEVQKVSSPLEMLAILNEMEKVNTDGRYHDDRIADIWKYFPETGIYKKFTRQNLTVITFEKI